MRKESQIISLNLGEKALPHSRSNDLDVFIKYMVHSSREAIWKQKAQDDYDQIASCGKPSRVDASILCFSQN